MTAMTKVNELAHTASTEMSDLVTAIDRAPEKEMSGTKLTKEEQKELFGDGFNDGYADEAEQRWGESEARKQSQKRTSKYTKAEWAEIKAEMDATNAAFVSAMADGEPATSERAMDAAEQHRLPMATTGSTTSPPSSTGASATCISRTRGSPRRTRT